MSTFFDTIMIDTIIRTHVKNQERFELLQRSVDSWFSHDLNSLGSLTIVNDQSPDSGSDMIQSFCEDNNIKYILTSGKPDTKNGLYYSLKEMQDKPALCCVDDLIFGKGIKEKLEYLVNEEYKNLSHIRWGMIGMFACYPKDIRHVYQDTGLWNIPNHILYALISHIFSVSLSKDLVSIYDNYLENNIDTSYRELFTYCDDIWVAKISTAKGYLNFNTLDDYTQHTGMNKRSFEKDEVGNSDYTTKCFVGE